MRQIGLRKFFSGLGFLSVGLLIVLGTAIAARAAENVSADWRQFRGTSNNPVAESSNGPPVSFDLKTGENVAWTASLPGRGASSPIVVGGRVFVTASEGRPKQDRLFLLAFDTETGRRCWSRRLFATGQTWVDPFGAVAQNTPASDGQRVVVFYSSNDLACFDLDGNLLWYRALGREHPRTRNDVGMASSPLVEGRLVIVQLENQGDSFAAGIDLETGETRWQIERDQEGVWSSPTLLPASGRSPGKKNLVLLHGKRGLTALEGETGKTVWHYPAEANTIGSVVGVDGRAYLPAWGIHAIQFDAENSAVRRLWHEKKLRGGNASPVVYQGKIYTIKPPGILVCGDLTDGKILWQLRMKGPFWATPVVASVPVEKAGRLYAVNYGGTVFVVDLEGKKGKIVGRSRFDTKILATPAVVGDALYLRSDASLCKIQSPQEKTPSGPMKTPSDR